MTLSASLRPSFSSCSSSYWGSLAWARRFVSQRRPASTRRSAGRRIFQGSMMVKRCSKCGELKRWDDFYPDNRVSSGRRRDCKKCRCMATQKNYRENLDDRRAYRRTQAKTEEGRLLIKKHNKTARHKFPERVEACRAVNKAIASGKLFGSPMVVFTSP